MNEHAIAVLIAFLTVAGIAVLLMRRALTTLTRQHTRNDAESVQVSSTSEPNGPRAEARSEP